MAQIKMAGASTQVPLSQAPRGRTGRLAQATRTTAQGASAVSSAKASLSNRKVKS